MDNTRVQTTAFVPLVLIVTLFFLWGVANNLNDILIPHLKKAFFLSDLQSSLVQSAFYLGYFFMALPSSIVMRRYGYKAAVLVGLLLFALGAALFYPAAQFRQYAWFLGALFVLASGLAFLETSANPLIIVLGDPDQAEQRLNLAQAFNPLGSITAVVVGSRFILSGVEPTSAQLAAMSATQLDAFQTSEAHATQIPYLAIAVLVLLWASLVARARFPPQAGPPDPKGIDAVMPLGQAIRALMGHPRFLFGLIALFFYEGAQVGIWSYMIRYAQSEVAGLGEKAAAGFLTWSLAGFIAGRFVGTAAMTRFSPTLLMSVCAAINVFLTLTSALVGGQTGLYALVATSCFMSIMFPTIFSTSLRGLGPLVKTGSSLLVMCIAGGAVFTALMGAISDASAMNVAILVPTVCFTIVALFGLTASYLSRPDAYPLGAG